MPSLTELYDAYVDTFRGADGTLPPMMELKRIHTVHVVANARLIAEGEGFDAAVARELQVADVVGGAGCEDCGNAAGYAQQEILYE